MTAQSLKCIDTDQMHFSILGFYKIFVWDSQSGVKVGFVSTDMLDFDHTSTTSVHVAHSKLFRPRPVAHKTQGERLKSTNHLPHCITSSRFPVFNLLVQPHYCEELKATYDF